MARDYARKQSSGKGAVNRAPTPRRKTGTRASKPGKAPRQPQAGADKQSGGLSVRWILSLAAVGGFIGFIVYLNSLEPVDREPSRAEQPPASQPADPAPDQTGDTAAEEPRFKFYDMLPESEVVPPTVDEYTPSPANQDFRYLVQAGSFRTPEDAERQRAEIAFQGLRAKVARIEVEEGNTWYRVNVGPFDSRSQMNSAVDKLVAINVQPLVRKIPKE